MNDLISDWTDVAQLAHLYQPEALLYLTVLVAVLSLGKWSYGKLTGIRLSAELAERDNPASALALAAYTLALAFLTWGVLTADGLPSLAHDLSDLVISSVVGLVLLHLGRMATDRFVFPRFDVTAAVREGNLGASAAQAGNYLGTGLILMRALAIDGESEAVRLADGAVFFLAAQLAFSLFALVYQRVTRFDVGAEIQAGNAAAGVALGLTLVAQGLLLSYAIVQTTSLVVFAAWFVMSSLLLVALRLAVDHILLRGHQLDEEIARDKNWGVGLVEGTVALSVALLLTGAF